VITDPLAIFFVLAAIVFVALRLEARLPLFRSLGAGLVSLLLGMLLSNTGLIAGESTTYQLLSRTGVSLGVVFILLSVDIKSVIQAGPRMLGAFGLGALGTVIGTMTASFFLADTIGAEIWKLSGQYTGTYIGGGVNFAALAQTFDTSNSLFSAAVAADVALTAVWMATCLAVPVLLGRPRRNHETPAPVTPPPEKRPMTLEHRLYESGRSVRIVDLAALATIGVGALWLSRRLESASGVPSVLWLTTLGLAAAQVRVIRDLPASALVGNYLVMLFLAGNGAQSVLANILKVGPGVFYFALITVALHGLVIFGVGRLAGLDFGTLAIASQANVGGAASAMAMASARGYMDKLLPGIAVGLLGYAVGNYIGFAVGTFVRSWLG
jgi:uncharacterized membrane protein